MNKTRLDPLGLLAPRGAASQTAGRKAEVARMNNTVLGACPVCAVEMPIVSVGEVQAYVCMEHCACLPTKDPA